MSLQLPLAQVIPAVRQLQATGELVAVQIDPNVSRRCHRLCWRVDETYIRVKGRWCYLYRAIDSAGATLDFLLSALRDADAAKRLLRNALSDLSHPQPRVINTDLAPIYGSAIAYIKKRPAAGAATDRSST